jgi:hypothetical protein
MKKFNSFNDVAKCYAETIPIRGKKKAWDIRPIGERRYHWNRIIKFDENTYGLTDGYWTNTDPTRRFGDEDTKKLSPVIWERKPDGDYMTLHSHLSQHCAVSRYWFIRNYTPTGFDFDWYTRTGKHFIKYKGVEYYLPKSVVAMDYGNKVCDFKEYYNLIFKHEADGNFTRVGDKNLCTTRRLDKSLTKEYRPHIKKFFEYMQVMLPVFGGTLGIRDTKENYTEQLKSGNSFWYWTKRVEPMLVRDILKDVEHENHIALAVLCANEVGMVKDCRFVCSEKSLSNLNALFNRIGGFYAKEEM